MFFCIKTRSWRSVGLFGSMHFIKIVSILLGFELFSNRTVLQRGRTDMLELEHSYFYVIGYEKYVSQLSIAH